MAIAGSVVRPGIMATLAIGREVAASGSPPTPEQAAQLQALQHRSHTAGRVVVPLLIVAVAAMAAARYLSGCPSPVLVGEVPDPEVAGLETHGHLMACRSHIRGTLLGADVPARDPHGGLVRAILDDAGDASDFDAAERRL